MTKSAQDQTASSGQALRVLAAEDNPTNQLLLTALLSPLDVELRLVADGAEAVEAFRGGTFDLVLMDIQMPVMNGVDAAYAIRALERAEGRRPTAILALTAHASPYQVEAYFAAGMNGFVGKPFQVRTLFKAIGTALARAQAIAA
jgi:CheY-like chemotaxis protein